MLFLCHTVLQIPLSAILPITRVRTPLRLPAVLSRSEVRAILLRLTGVPWLAASLLYGSGLRLLERLELRVKDIDIERHQITVRQGKDRKDRVTMLPGSVVPDLLKHVAGVMGTSV